MVVGGNSMAGMYCARPLLSSRIAGARAQRAHPDTATRPRTVPVRSAHEQGVGLDSLKASLVGEAAADGDRPRSARHDSAPVSRCAPAALLPKQGGGFSRATLYHGALLPVRDEPPCLPFFRPPARLAAVPRRPRWRTPRFR